MRCIIPAAGQGTRLRPHTHTKPKALLTLGNKPLISYILDNVVKANISDIIIIVGYERDKLTDFVKSNYGETCNLTFIEQKNRLGLGHAIYSAVDYLDGEPVLIVLGDCLYEKSFAQMLEDFSNFPDWIGAITIKSVPNPQAYGVVITHEDSYTVKHLEEKPKKPTSSKAITGIYMIRDSKLLRSALEEIITTKKFGSGGEFQLTDALQIMVNKGLTLGTLESGRWFDCGRKEALLAAHKYVLSQNQMSSIKSNLNNSIIIEPVVIQSDCYISNSVIGPYVSIDRGTIIERSIISNSIIGIHSHIENAGIADSLIGDKVRFIGQLYDLNVGDHSKVKFS
ncbi:MAG: sugar phosphate nucleotidyltransferase [Candidatus Hodarchaeota archaeon]